MLEMASENWVIAIRSPNDTTMQTKMSVHVSNMGFLSSTGTLNNPTTVMWTTNDPHNYVVVGREQIIKIL